MNVLFDNDFRLPDGITEAEITQALYSAINNGHVFQSEDGDSGRYFGYSQNGCVTIWVVWYSNNRRVTIKSAYYHRITVKPID